MRVNTGEQAAWTVAKHAVAKLGYEDCVVYLINDDGVLYQCAAHGAKNPIAHDIDNPITLKMGEGICGFVAQSGEGEIIGDTSIDSRYTVDDSNRFSEITIPIMADGQVIGIIDSEHPEKDYFTDQDFEILTTIASMVSAKIDQAKAHEEIAKHREDLKIKVDESTKELQETIVALRASNELIRESNLEKETLLKEIHHRVKNNLQIVSSLLNLHANKADAAAADVFYDCQNRIKSMSVIHEQLYNKDNLAEIDAEKYINEICTELLGSFNASKNIKIELNIEPLFFDIDQSVPFGLIVNELIVNTLKHAFPNQAGTLSVSLRQQGHMIELIIEDNGPGFDVNSIGDTMGLELVDTLTSQLDGQLQMTSNRNGTSVKIGFPAK